MALPYIGYFYNFMGGFMTDTNDAFAPIEKSGAVHKFEFTGTWQELLPLALKNFFLNVITLSLYRFWGRTRVRRYLWSRTSIMGDPFEYAGNGKELFFGFVIVLLIVFVPFFGMLYWGQMMLLTDPMTGGIIMAASYIGLLFLFGVGWYRAQKFRLSRTRWRGIRGGLEDNGVKYGLKFLGYTILNVFTLGFAAPYSANKLWSAESNTRRFGTAKFSYNGFASQFYGRFFGAIGIMILMMIAIVVLMSFLAIGTALSMDSLGSGQTPEITAAAILSMIFVYLAYVFSATFAYTFYQFGKMRVFWNHTKLENAEFHFTGTLGGMLKMIIGNFFIEILTLGILHPIAQMRWLRYFSTNLEIYGNLDLEAIAQREGEVMTYGEGLAEGFDFGGV